MGYVGTEVPADTKVQFRPLLGLQVWLHARARDNEWVQTIAQRVTEADPEGLYIHWADLPWNRRGSVVIRNAAYLKRPLYRAFADRGLEEVGLRLDPDLYDVVRINGPVIDEKGAAHAEEELVAALRQLRDYKLSPDPLIRRAVRLRRMLDLMPVEADPEPPAPKQEVVPAPEKPWWED